MQRVVAVLVAVVVLQLGVIVRSARADPFMVIDTCVVTVTNVATSVQQLLVNTAGCPTGIGECFKVANPAAGVTCLGGTQASTGNAITPGSRCWAVCSGVTCAESVTSVPASIVDSFLRAPVNTDVQLLLGNGC